MNALAPKTEGLIITQLTKDVISIAKGVPGASVNFDYVTKILVILACIYFANAILRILQVFYLRMLFKTQ